MRGAPHDHPVPVARIGIIPADAGSTRSQPSASSPGGDHPRGCGEHPIWDNQLRTTLGSSPRMRGALKRLIDDVHVMGIIPADAGSTSQFFIDHCRG